MSPQIVPRKGARHFWHQEWFKSPQGDHIGTLNLFADEQADAGPKGVEAAPVGEAGGPCEGRRAEAELRAHAQIRVSAGVVICGVRLQRSLWPHTQHHMVQRPRHIVILHPPLLPHVTTLQVKLHTWPLALGVLLTSSCLHHHST